jgi:hypothetical protein
MSDQRQAPAALPPGKTRYPLCRRLGGPQGRSGRVRKIFPRRDSIPGPSSSKLVAVSTELSRSTACAQCINSNVCFVQNCDMFRCIYIFFSETFLIHLKLQNQYTIKSCFSFVDFSDIVTSGYIRKYFLKMM